MWAHVGHQVHPSEQLSIHATCSCAWPSRPKQLPKPHESRGPRSGTIACRHPQPRQSQQWSDMWHALSDGTTVGRGSKVSVPFHCPFPHQARRGWVGEWLGLRVCCCTCTFVALVLSEENGDEQTTMGYCRISLKPHLTETQGGTETKPGIQYSLLRSFVLPTYPTVLQPSSCDFLKAPLAPLAHSSSSAAAASRTPTNQHG